MFKINKANYRITIISWENDGDYRKTITKDGFNKKQALAIINVCNLLSLNQGFDNMYEPTHKENVKLSEAFKSIYMKSNTILNSLGYNSVNIDNTYDLIALFSEITNHFVGFPEEDGRYTRVVDSFKVEYIKSDIVIEDVTEKFQ